MRRVFLALAAVVSLTAAGCSTATTPQDPYEIVHKAVDTPWQQVQVDLGASVKSAGTTVTLDPGTVRIIVDSTAGKGSFHLSLPAAALGADASSLAQLGVTGSTLDFDALYDGQALYAKSPLLKTVVTMLMTGSVDMPSGDLSGWLRLATKSDFDALASGALDTPAPSASLDTATLKKDLNDNGLTLTLVGTEKRNGSDADHVSVAIDANKLLSSPMLNSAQQGQVDQLKEAAKTATLSADVWTDHGSGKLTEIDIHVVSTGTTAGSGDVTITLSAPASGTSFDTPPNALDVPAKTLIGNALKMFGQSLGQ